MSEKPGRKKKMVADRNIDGVSVVMPSYNASDWLEVTLGKIEVALKEAGLNQKRSEIVIIDDGSIDDTKDVVRRLAKTSKVKIHYIYQENSGRYLARKNGVEHAEFNYVWFVDTRVHVAASSLKYALYEVAKSPENAVWNAHVYVQKKGNVIARFMDAITYIGWRKYFKKPRRCSYGLKEFDYYPKGTTSFLVPKKLIVDAMKEFEKEEHDMQRSSDDTHLIRIISRDHSINLSPKFSCKYHARSTLKAFTKHSYHRGQVFIDGFFRPDTRFYAPIIMFLLVSALSVVALTAIPSLIPWFISFFVVIWLAELIIALGLGVNSKDALSLFALTPLFVICYGAGLWTAFLKKVWQAFISPRNRKSIIRIMIALVFFMLCTMFFYLGKSSFSPTTTLAAGPGDQTGLIWLNTMVNAPLWGTTDISNAPYGENLQSPVHITGALEYWLFWAASLMAGPIFGYNLFTSLELIFSAMTVFLFVRWLTRRSDVALFAGFVATFTPYLQIKTGVHPSYASFGVLVLAIWLTIILWQKATKFKAILLGLVMTTFFFIDPYFILLGGVTMVLTIGVFMARSLYVLYHSRKDSVRLQLAISRAKSFFGSILLAGLVTFILGLGPLIVTNLQHGDQISSEVSSVRSDIKQEVLTYSARPFEYILPNPSNPFIGKINLSLPDILTRKPHGSNPAEDSISLSSVLLIIASATVLFMIFRTFLRRSVLQKLPPINRKYMMVVGLFAVVGLGAMITSFPAKSDGLIFPSDIITNYIQIWRVYARLAVIVMFSLAIIAAIGLAIFTERLKPLKRGLIIAGLMVIVAFEFLTFNPLSDNRSWSYAQIHPFYFWLKEQSNVDTIAEYPLNEPGRTNVSTGYFRDQYIHRKKVINAYTSASSTAILRNGIRDLTDPQTPHTLASLGVDLVVVHVEDKKQLPAIDGLEEVDWNHSTNDNDSIYLDGQLKVYRVTASKDADGYILVPGMGFAEQVRFNSTYTEVAYLFGTNAELSVFNLNTGKVSSQKGLRDISFRALADDGETQLAVVQAGKTLWDGRVTSTGRGIKITIDMSKPILLQLDGSQKHGSVLISNINMY